MAAASLSAASAQPRNPLHGLTLEAMLLALEAQYGWDGLAERIPVRCFSLDPSVASSLKFLRKTPWARAKVEGLYLFMLREQVRAGRGGEGLLESARQPVGNPHPSLCGSARTAKCPE